jgi:hypothetical protein
MISLVVSKCGVLRIGLEVATAKPESSVSRKSHIELRWSMREDTGYSLVER